VPEWSKEFGGAGLTAGQRYIINQEVAARNIELPGHWGNFQGGVPGPTMMKFATEEQKKEWLPKIAAGALFSLGYTNQMPAPTSHHCRCVPSRTVMITLLTVRKCSAAASIKRIITGY